MIQGLKVEDKTNQVNRKRRSKEKTSFQKNKTQVKKLMNIKIKDLMEDTMDKINRNDTKISYKV